MKLLHMPGVPLKTFWGKLHICWLQFTLAVVYAFHYPFFLVLSRSPKYYRLLNIARRSCSGTFMGLSGIFLRIRYEEALEPDGTYVFCSNHTSYLDIPAMCCIANGPYYFMGKDELLRNPLFRLFFKTIDIPVKRESKLDSYRAFRRACENLQKGMSLVIFPEGTISDAPPAMRAFKNGAFRLAIESQVPIVPVSITNTWSIMYDKGQQHGSRPGIIHIFVHKPIQTRGLALSDDEQLKEKVAAVIGTKLSENAR